MQYNTKIAFHISDVNQQSTVNGSQPCFNL